MKKVAQMAKVDDTCDPMVDVYLQIIIEWAEPHVLIGLEVWEIVSEQSGNANMRLTNCIIMPYAESRARRLYIAANVLPDKHFIPTTMSNPSSSPPSQADKSPQNSEYPEQRHAGKVGYGPNFTMQPSISDRFEGLYEEAKAKLTHNEALHKHGHDLRTGELKRKQLFEHNDVVRGDPVLQSFKDAEAKKDAQDNSQQDTPQPEKNGNVAHTSGN
ncbi:hypothetical protein AMATHDRAFT_49398 [Amanita thiersii Skay4041]|uniref:Uncharacterized protein n=1 Tax=Amanita thiersii Skay4041 TaxID=703135 RepID=A0A2A9NLM0_9AGAR|nr:hypothetical protein AMATHDRAFT_49398 [Amanita thiersii Skay4041]